MGLGFHIGQGGIDDLGEYIGQLEMDEIAWLQKFGFLVKGSTGHRSDDPLSLPYFDDVILSHQQVEDIKRMFDARRSDFNKDDGFHSSVVHKMDEILNRLIAEKQGLSTCAD